MSALEMSKVGDGIWGWAGNGRPLNELGRRAMATHGEKAFQKESTSNAKALRWGHDQRGLECKRASVCAREGGKEAKGGKKEVSRRISQKQGMEPLLTR